MIGQNVILSSNQNISKALEGGTMNRGLMNDNRGLRNPAYLFSSQKFSKQCIRDAFCLKFGGGGGGVRGGTINRRLMNEFKVSKQIIL